MAYDIEELKGTTGVLTATERKRINDLITRVNSTWSRPPHGYMSFDDESETPAMSQSDGWTQISNATDDIFCDCDVVGITQTGDSLVIIAPGDYISICSLSFSGNNTDSYEFALLKNGEVIGPKIVRTTLAQDTGNVGIPFYAKDLVAGDILTLGIRNSANDNDATLVACSWVVWVLHY